MTTASSSAETKTIAFKIYRYDPEIDKAPRMQDYTLTVPAHGDLMLLTALMSLKELDPTLTFRHSCREGICGSDGMNINGTNGLACVTQVSSLKQPIVLRPLPSLPVIKDLVVDMTQFYAHYNEIDPYLINDNPPCATENLQSPEDREKLDGLYECILCACCTTSCPSFWWNPDKFIGPAGLLQALRFLIDSRDTAKKERLKKLDEDVYKIGRCHSIGNCAAVCPKGLNPTKAITTIREMMLDQNT